MKNNESELIQQYCLRLVNHSKMYIQYSVEIEYIYIYISIELNGFLNVFFEKDNLVVKKNKVNKLSNKELDVSIDAQSNFNETGNNILNEFKSVLVKENIISPTQIKIIYNNKTEQIDIDLSFDEYINEQTIIGMPDYAEKWFAELGGELSQNSLYRMKQLFGDDFLDKKNS